MKSFSTLFLIMIAANFSQILISSQAPKYKAEREEVFRRAEMFLKSKPVDCRNRKIGKHPGASSRKGSNRMPKFDGLSANEALLQADLLEGFSCYQTGDKKRVHNLDSFIE